MIENKNYLLKRWLPLLMIVPLLGLASCKPITGKEFPAYLDGVYPSLIKESDRIHGFQETGSDIFFKGFENSCTDGLLRGCTAVHTETDTGWPVHRYFVNGVISINGEGGGQYDIMPVYFDYETGEFVTINGEVVPRTGIAGWLPPNCAQVNPGLYSYTSVVHDTNGNLEWDPEEVAVAEFCVTKRQNP